MGGLSQHGYGKSSDLFQQYNSALSVVVLVMRGMLLSPPRQRKLGMIGVGLCCAFLGVLLPSRRQFVGPANVMAHGYNKVESEKNRGEANSLV